MKVQDNIFAIIEKRVTARYGDYHAHPKREATEKSILGYVRSEKTALCLVKTIQNTEDRLPERKKSLYERKEYSYEVITEL